MELKRVGKYKYLTESYISVDKNSGEAYEFISHIYSLDNGKTFVEYEKIKSKKAEFFKEMELGKYD